MIITKDYQNALTEVYEILNTLEIDEFNKIPEDIISAIKENRNLDYDYKIDDGIDLKEQQMLPETKAILFNLYRDYLVSSEQKEKIKKIQTEERKKLK